MFQQLLSSGGYGLNSLGVRLYGGIVDFIYVLVHGVTVTGTGTAADVNTALRQILDSMKIEGDFTGTDGNAGPFVSGPATVGHFRTILNYENGYLAPTDGVLIATGRRHLAEKEGFTINLDWSAVGALPAGVDVSAAKVEVRRVQLGKLLPESLHPVYAVRKDDGRTVPVLTDNVAIGYYLDGTFDALTIKKDGRDTILPASLIRAVSAMGEGHEDEGAPPPYKILDADLVSAQSEPEFLTQNGDGVFFQIGSRPDAAAMSRAQAMNAEKVETARRSAS